MPVFIDLGAQASGDYLLVDDGTENNNTSQLLGPNGFVITIPHPADDVTILMRPGQTILVDLPESLGTSNLKIGDIFASSQRPDSIQIGRVQTSGVVTLASRGAITERFPDSQADITAGQLFMLAATGIGVGNPIETSVSLLEAESNTGGINLVNSGNLTIGAIVSGIRGLFTGTSGNITLTNFGNITFANDDEGTESVHSAGHVTLTAAAGDISSLVSRDAIFAAGNITLVARDILFGTGNFDFDNDVRAGGSVTFAASRDVTISGSSSVTADDFGPVSNGGISVSAGGTIVVQNNFQESAVRVVASGSTGSVTLTTGVGGTLNLLGDSTAVVSAGVGGVTLHADRLIMTAFTGVTATNNGVVAITTASPGRNINLGVTNDPFTSLDLSDVELDRIFAQNLIIGGTQSGDLSVVGEVSTTIPNLTLQSGGSMFVFNDITAGANLTLNSAEDLYFNGLFDITAGTFVAAVDTPDNDAPGGLLSLLVPTNGLIVGSQSLNGNADADTLRGNGGPNSLFGFGGNDTLDGGGGNDTTTGGPGNDAHAVDSAGDVVVEATGEGSDRVLASASYTLPAAAEVELLSASNQAGTAAMDFIGNGFNQSIFGNDGVNGLEGRGGSDLLFGLGGNDALNGGIGNDTTVGGAGDDAHFVDSANDAVLEAAGEGSDRVLALVSYALGGSAEVELISAADQMATTALDLTGNGFNQIIFGNEGVNALDGGGGTDTLRGLGGNDVYLVDTNDTVVEAAGGGNDRVLATANYTLPAGAEVELLSAANQNGTTPLTLIGNELPNNIQANEGDNVLVGGGGPDTLFGLGGSDVLNGGPGNDMLNGGAGGDGIVFGAVLAPGHVDTIIGFAPGADRIFLDDAVFSALGTGALPAGAFRTGTAALDADDRIIYDPATGALFYDPDGNGTAVAQIQFAALQGAPAVTIADFLVI